jgi:hypothetical protein
MVRIDLRDILQRTVSAMYGDLVTRPTGRAVRSGIERELAVEGAEVVAVIEFGAVGCLDFSCADEIVGRLLLDHGGVRTFVLHGVSADQREAIEPVLERHGLTVVSHDRDGRVELLGPLSETARRAFRIVTDAGAAAADDVARLLAVSTDSARAALNELLERRLVLASGGAYQALTLA